LAFVVSAAVETLAHGQAPPDTLSMSMMAISIYLFFEAGLFLARLFQKR
jgi:Sec-independent protein secretion pathway component TatC